jgi:hypothetical protein
MKTRSSLRAGLAGLIVSLAAFGATSNVAFAHEGHKKETPPASAPGHSGMQMPGADAKAAYPMATCVVSGDKLEDGDMGPPIDYIHKEEGKPDRLVRLCCKGCVKDFKKDPAKYLKMIDDAAAAKAKGEKPADHGGGHKH